MTKMVRSAQEAIAAIEAFNRELSAHPALAARLGQAHAYYVTGEDTDEPSFGFSKFVGYRGLTGETYLRDYKELTGINTEHALAEWFEEIRYGSPQYKRLFAKLSDWMARYGKRPRQGDSQKLRLMIVKPAYRSDEPVEAEDRDLLDLLVAVVHRLPDHQRRALKAAI